MDFERVFQLAEREILTAQCLDELEINGIRLSKFKNGEIGIEFIWIDVDNLHQMLLDGWRRTNNYLQILK